MKTLTYNFFLFEVDTNSRYKLASERIICIAMLKKKKNLEIKPDFSIILETIRYISVIIEFSKSFALPRFFCNIISILASFFFRAKSFFNTFMMHMNRNAF